MAVWIDEFLYRGRAPGSLIPPAWHVNLSADGTDPFGQPVVHTRQLAMAAAVAQGWTLPVLIQEINAELLAELSIAREALAAIKTLGDSPVSFKKPEDVQAAIRTAIDKAEKAAPAEAVRRLETANRLGIKMSGNIKIASLLSDLPQEGRPGQVPTKMEEPPQGFFKRIFGS